MSHSTYCAPLPSAGLHARAAELTEIQGAANDTVQIHETTDDILVLPDKYNTGCHGTGLNWNSLEVASAFTSMVRYITPDTQNRIVFEDIVTSDSNWIYTAAKFVYERNIMNGVGISPSQKPIFKPNSPITRGEFAQVLYNMVKRPKIVYSNVFTDLPKAQWYTNAVTWVYQNKIGPSLPRLPLDGISEPTALLFSVYKQISNSTGQ